MLLREDIRSLKANERENAWMSVRAVLAVNAAFCFLTSDPLFNKQRKDRQSFSFGSAGTRIGFALQLLVIAVIATDYNAIESSSFLLSSDASISS